jgi:hypothetical protein
MIILWALLGGLTYRIKGGLIDDILHREFSNTLIRSVWALYVTLMLPLSIYSPAAFILAFAGVIMGYWGGKFDLTKKENRTIRNFLILACRGAFIMFPLALSTSILSIVNFSPVYCQLWYGVIAGALMPLYYLAGLGIGEIFKIQGKSQWGEWLIGIAIGSVLV